MPVDDLVRELIQTGRTATNDEIQQILERLATAPLDTHLVRVPGYLRGQTYAGRMLRDRDESSIVHLVKRVRHDRQWAEGTTEADFLDDLHGVARQADARLLVYGRHGQHHTCVFAETARVLPPSRRGEQALPNLLVVYLSERSVLRTGYQFSDLAALRIPGDARWLK